MVPHAACTAPVPLATSLGTRALSATRVPMSSPEAGPADPDRHAVRRRALLVGARTRGEGEGASGHEHERRDEEPAPHVALTMWTSLRPLRSTR